MSSVEFSTTQAMSYCWHVKYKESNIAVRAIKSTAAGLKAFIWNYSVYIPQSTANTLKLEFPNALFTKALSGYSVKHPSQVALSTFPKQKIHAEQSPTILSNGNQETPGSTNNINFRDGEGFGLHVSTQMQRFEINELTKNIDKCIARFRNANELLKSAKAEISAAAKELEKRDIKTVALYLTHKKADVSTKNHGHHEQVLTAWKLE